MKIYLFSIVMSLLGMVISAKAIEAELKREGYKLKKRNKHSIWEWLKVLIIFCIPVFNILVMLVSLFSNEVKESIKDKMFTK